MTTFKITQNERHIEIPLIILEKYPESPIYYCWKDFEQNNMTFEDLCKNINQELDFDTFIDICEVICDKCHLADISFKAKTIMDKWSLISTEDADFYKLIQENNKETYSNRNNKNKIRSICLHKTSQKGLRPTNEDIMEYLINLNSDGTAMDLHIAPIDIFIICDGHAGKAVASYICPRLVKLLSKKTLIYPLSDNFIIKLFNQVQNELINHKNKIGLTCGSTCNIVIRYMDKFNKENIQVINIGDSRAVLSKNGFSIPLTKDHKPHWISEKKRIDDINKKENLNSKVTYNGDCPRILGVSFTRAFGDLDCIPYVTHIPEIFNYSLQITDEFIIIATNGLWDVISNEVCVNFVKDHLNNNIEHYTIPGKYLPNTANSINIARKLAQYAIAKGSSDNISIHIIFFG